MIRSDFDISDADFEKVDKPFQKATEKYLKENFIYDYLAFYIATGYKMSALWKGKLTGVFNGAIDDLCNIKFGTEVDIKILRNILMTKYNLLLTSDVNLEIKELD